MRALIAALCLSFGAAGLASAAPADDAVATVHHFFDAFDKGDIAGAEATHAPDVSIIDEVPPHEWHGPGAFQAWLGALDAGMKAQGQTDGAVTLGDTIRADVNGDAAYVVVATTFNYKQRGAPITEPSEAVFSLKNGAGGWKITGWAWAGQVPRPAK